MTTESLVLDTAASLLPAWVRWGGVMGTALVALMAAGAGGGVAAWIALRRTHRLRELAWPERARVTFAAKRAMASGASATAFLCAGVACAFAGPFSVLPALGLSAVGWLVGVVVGICWYRFVAQRLRDEPLPLRIAARSGALAALLFASPVIPMLLGLGLMPSELGSGTLVALAVATAGMLLLAAGGAITIGRAVELIRPADARLGGIVDTVARQLGVRVAAVYEMDWWAVNAFALPLRGVLLFTARAAAELSDEEIAAVAGHELGHLKESRGITALRILRTLLMIPFILLLPVMTTYGWMGALYVMVPVVVAARAFAACSRRWETRADGVAHAAASEGVYARALERMHQINLLPVVFGRGATHPDLYDRMLAAGVTPAYPRPQPPPRFTGLAALGAALFVAGALALAAPLSLMWLIGNPGNDPTRMQVSLLLERRSNAGTLARLATQRAVDGDAPAAIAFYRAAAQITGSQWSAAAYRAAAMAAASRCHDARRLLAVANGVYSRYYGRDDRWSFSLEAAQAAVERCAELDRSRVIAAGAQSL